MRKNNLTKKVVLLLAALTLLGTLPAQAQEKAIAATTPQITVPVTIVHAEHDEFITREHAQYLARSIPNAQFVELRDVSHFAPLQRPDQFNNAVLDFLAEAIA